MLNPYEERITRKIFEPLAGRKLSEKEVEEIINDIKVTAEIVRMTPWLREELGVGENHKPKKKGNPLAVDRPNRTAYAAGDIGGPMPVTTKQQPVGNIAYTIQVFKEGRVYVAHTPELDVSSQGETVEEAKAHLREAVEAFVEEAQRMGTLTDVLTEAGYEHTTEGWKAPDLLAQERATVSLPR
ncbi:MAG: type II toxin-antitoxin system HicB family antitoxin [bacterium]